MTAANIMPGVQPERGTYALLLNSSLDRQNIDERLTLPHSKIQKSIPINSDEELEPASERSSLLNRRDLVQGYSSVAAPLNSTANSGTRHSAIGRRDATQGQASILYGYGSSSDISCGIQPSEIDRRKAIPSQASIPYGCVSSSTLNPGIRNSATDRRDAFQGQTSAAVQGRYRLSSGVGIQPSRKITNSQWSGGRSVLESATHPTVLEKSRSTTRPSSQSTGHTLSYANGPLTQISPAGHPPIHTDFQATPTGRQVHQNPSLKRKEPSFSIEDRNVAQDPLNGKKLRLETGSPSLRSQPVPNSVPKQAEPPNGLVSEHASAGPFRVQGFLELAQGRDSGSRPLPNQASINSRYRQLMPRYKESDLALLNSGLRDGQHRSVGEASAGQKVGSIKRGRAKSPKYKSQSSHTFGRVYMHNSQHLGLPTAQTQPTFGILKPNEVEEESPEPIERPRPLQPLSSQGKGKTTRNYPKYTIEISSARRCLNTKPSAPRAKSYSHYHPDTAVPSIERDDATIQESRDADFPDPMNVSQDVLRASRIASQIGLNVNNGGGYVNAERSLALASQQLDKTGIYPPISTLQTPYSTSTSANCQSSLSNQTTPAVNLREYCKLSSTLQASNTPNTSNSRPKTLQSRHSVCQHTPTNLPNTDRQEFKGFSMDEKVMEGVQQSVESPNAARVNTTDPIAVLDCSQAQLEENAENDSNDTDSLFGPESPRDSSPVASQLARAEESGTGSSESFTSKEVPATIQAESDNAIDIEYATLLSEPDELIMGNADSMASTDGPSDVSQEESDSAIDLEFASLLGEPKQQASEDTVEQQASDNAIDTEFADLLTGVAETSRVADRISVSPEATESNQLSPTQSQTYGTRKRSPTSAAQTQSPTERQSMDTRLHTLKRKSIHDDTLRMNNTSNHFLGGGRKYDWLSNQNDGVYTRPPKPTPSKKGCTRSVETTENARLGSNESQQSSPREGSSFTEVGERQVIDLTGGDDDDVVAGEESLEHQNSSHTRITPQPHAAPGRSASPCQVVTRAAPSQYCPVTAAPLVSLDPAHSYQAPYLQSAPINNHQYYNGQITFYAQQGFGRTYAPSPANGQIHIRANAMPSQFLAIGVNAGSRSLVGATNTQANVNAHSQHAENGFGLLVKNRYYDRLTRNELKLEVNRRGIRTHSVNRALKSDLAAYLRRDDAEKDRFSAPLGMDGIIDRRTQGDRLIGASTEVINLDEELEEDEEEAILQERTDSSR